MHVTYELLHHKTMFWSMTGPLKYFDLPAQLAEQVFYCGMQYKIIYHRAMQRVFAAFYH